MTFRMGGEIEIASASLAEPVRHCAPSLPKPYIAKLATGRSALQISLQEIVRRGGRRKAWLPAYICGAVVSVFRGMDFELNYYPTGRRLADQEFPKMVARDETFLYTHYFGKSNHAAIRWLDQADYPGKFYVIEDCVQASLNSNVGAAGDYAITSYRKFLPQPDGALLGANSPIETRAEEPDEAFVSAKFLGKLLRYQSGGDELYLSLISDSETRLDSDTKPRRMSWLSEFMVQRTDIPDISARRRQNWIALSNLIGNGPLAERGLSPIYNDLDTGEVPLGFPVTVTNGKRDALRRHLAENQIYCPVHWELPHLQSSSDWREEKELSQSILTLPIDQRFGQEHLTYMLKIIKSFLELCK